VQVEFPGVHAMHPTLAEQVCPVAAQSVTLGAPPSELHTVATLPEQLIGLKVPGAQGAAPVAASDPPSGPAVPLVPNVPQPASNVPPQTAPHAPRQATRKKKAA
jgi:hypothetical protein